ncbi:MAG: HDOD domain-containing protein, partial [Myxococcales bacterium]|nr:HDOD domain-containing protein [Myxococcales bacterium]
ALAGVATAVHRANYGVDDRALTAAANKLWLAHFVRAVTAESLASEVGHPRPAQLRTLSLFADIGELMLLRAASALWPEHLAGGQPSDDLRAFAVDHARRLSALLLAEWGMPTRYVVLARHAPGDAGASLTTEDRANRELLAGARHLADAAVGPGLFQREPVPTDSMVTVPAEIGAEVTRTAIAHVRSMIYA